MSTPPRGPRSCKHGAETRRARRSSTKRALRSDTWRAAGAWVRGSDTRRCGSSPRRSFADRSALRERGSRSWPVLAGHAKMPHAYRPEILKAEELGIRLEVVGVSHWGGASRVEAPEGGGSNPSQHSAAPRCARRMRARGGCLCPVPGRVADVARCRGSRSRSSVAATWRSDPRPRTQCRWAPRAREGAQCGVQRRE